MREQNLELAKRQSWARVNNLKATRAKGHCEVCSHQWQLPKLLGHHLVSLKDGGEDKDSNIIIVCPKCVNVIHAMQALEFAGRHIDVSTCYMNTWQLLLCAIKGLLSGRK